MSSDKDLREDVEEMRNALKEATERLRAAGAQSCCSDGSNHLHRGLRAEAQRH